MDIVAMVEKNTVLVVTMILILVLTVEMYFPVR